MRKQKTYTTIFGRRFSDDLLDPAFVVGVIGLFILGIMMLSETSGFYKGLGWFLSIDLLGLSATLLWAAYEFGNLESQNTDCLRTEHDQLE